MKKTVYSFDDINTAIKTHLDLATKATSACQEALEDNNYLLVRSLCLAAMVSLEDIRFYATRVVEDTSDFGGVA